MWPVLVSTLMGISNLPLPSIWEGYQCVPGSPWSMWEAGTMLEDAGGCWGGWPLPLRRCCFERGIRVHIRFGIPGNKIFNWTGMRLYRKFVASQWNTRQGLLTSLICRGEWGWPSWVTCWCREGIAWVVNFIEWMRKPWFLTPVSSSSKYALKWEENMSVYDFAQICVHSWGGMILILSKP